MHVFCGMEEWKWGMYKQRVVWCAPNWVFSDTRVWRTSKHHTNIHTHAHAHTHTSVCIEHIFMRLSLRMCGGMVLALFIVFYLLARAFLLFCSPEPYLVCSSSFILLWCTFNYNCNRSSGDRLSTLLLISLLFLAIISAVTVMFGMLALVLTLVLPLPSPLSLSFFSSYIMFVLFCVLNIYNLHTANHAHTLLVFMLLSGGDTWGHMNDVQISPHIIEEMASIATNENGLRQYVNYTKTYPMADFVVGLTHYCFHLWVSSPLFPLLMVVAFFLLFSFVCFYCVFLAFYWLVVSLTYISVILVGVCLGVPSHMVVFYWLFSPLQITNVDVSLFLLSCTPFPFCVVVIAGILRKSIVFAFLVWTMLCSTPHLPLASNVSVIIFIACFWDFWDFCVVDYLFIFCCFHYGSSIIYLMIFLFDHLFRDGWYQYYLWKLVPFASLHGMFVHW